MLKRLISSREALLIAAILALLALISTRFPGFVAPSNLAAVFNDTAPLILLAIGQMIVILTRCIDLSVAANLALTGMVAAMVNLALPGLPPRFRAVHRDRRLLRGPPTARHRPRPGALICRAGGPATA